LVTREFCCLDYDNGGTPDDGLLVVHSTDGHVVLAEIFERSGTARNPATR
jgi:hypothetical protein